MCGCVTYFLKLLSLVSHVCVCVCVCVRVSRCLRLSKQSLPSMVHLKGTPSSCTHSRPVMCGVLSVRTQSGVLAWVFHCTVKLQSRVLSVYCDWTSCVFPCACVLPCARGRHAPSCQTLVHECVLCWHRSHSYISHIWTCMRVLCVASWWAVQLLWAERLAKVPQIQTHTHTHTPCAFTRLILLETCVQGVSARFLHIPSRATLCWLHTSSTCTDGLRASSSVNALKLPLKASRPLLERLWNTSETPLKHR